MRTCDQSVDLIEEIYLAASTPRTDFSNGVVTTNSFTTCLPPAAATVGPANAGAGRQLSTDVLLRNDSADDTVE